jgi:hypothetical protein
MKSCPIGGSVECEERDRLDAAYEAAKAKLDELESELGGQITSSNPNVSKPAKKRLEREQKHVSHILHQWLTHWKKHGCR